MRSRASGSGFTLWRDVAVEALREGWRERRFEMAELNRIAEACRMGRVMKPYLEAMMT